MLATTIMTIALVTSQGAVPLHDIQHAGWRQCVAAEVKFNRDVEQRLRRRVLHPVKLKEMAALQQNRLEAYCHA